ncbi:MAG: SpoVR family protein [Candidatus Dadabacteria bacterium]|nr:MAG: SpoVR family protein [Candidatus Dadabacteria bacterium]
MGSYDLAIGNHTKNSPEGFDLDKAASEIEQIAKAHGLDFYPVIFEMLSPKELHIVAARDGFPVRYPHPSWAVEFKALESKYETGMGKIYELVINTNPVIAYLLRGNTPLEQKMVIAHVYGHADFFKNNMFFASTDRNMLSTMSAHARKIKRYMEKYGRERVEDWIDRCRSIDNLLDPLASPAKSSISDYRGSRDVMLVVAQEGNLEEWQREILLMLREEALYFLPQIQTKIMNEGWASYWHTHLMEREVMDPSESVDFCIRHAGVVAVRGKELNPYKLGLDLFRYIEEEANKRGEDGRAKIFEVRRIHNDLTFLDEFLSLDFCESHGIIEFEREYSVKDREELFQMVKEELLDALTNRGQPVITVEDINYQGREIFYLKHHYTGKDLDIAKAQDTLEILYGILGKPVWIETVVEGERIALTYNGSYHQSVELESSGQGSL